jgi:hypothetical protein
MIRHLHADRDEIHVGMLRELFRVRERQRDECRADASADCWLAVQTAVISNCGMARSAGIWAIEANPRLAPAPTIPTRILPLSMVPPAKNIELDDPHVRLWPSLHDIGKPRADQGWGYRTKRRINPMHLNLEKLNQLYKLAALTQ